MIALSLKQCLEFIGFQWNGTVTDTLQFDKGGHGMTYFEGNLWEATRHRNGSAYLQLRLQQQPNCPRLQQLQRPSRTPVGVSLIGFLQHTGNV